MSMYGYQNTGQQGGGAYYGYGQAAGGQGQNQNQGPAAPVGSMGAMTPQHDVYAAGDMSGQRLSTGILAAFSASGYPGEPPLLEELGVNFGHITQKTLVVLNPFRTIDTNIMDDSDLAGPILFFLLFGTFLLLSGKVHFGYIYGVGLVGTVWQYAILNLMAHKSIDFLRTTSVLGYCLLPLVATSAVAVFVSMDNMPGYLLGSLAILWCAYSSSAIFVSYLQLSEMRILIAYPLALFYGIFSLMTLFADKTVAKTAALAAAQSVAVNLPPS